MQTSSYEQVLTEFAKLKAELQRIETARMLPEWISRKELMTYLGYGETRMYELLKDGAFTVAEIGKKKFILRQSVLDYLDRISKK